jgi:hypothetical protein
MPNLALVGGYLNKTVTTWRAIPSADWRIARRYPGINLCDVGLHGFDRSIVRGGNRASEKTMFEPSAASSNPAQRTKTLAALPLGRARNRIVAWLRSTRGQWPLIMNIGLLIAGLGLGQGTIFIVQTSLVAAGEYELLAAFGTHYSFAILGIILVDAGASTILARVVARLSAEQTSRDEVWRIFCETSAIRLLAALLIGTAAAVYASGFASDGFSRWYVALALPGLLFWAINAVGLLDGLRLSGISGITGSAAYVVTAIGLALAAHRSPEAAGAILGGAFSLGYLLTLGAQWIVLGRKGWFPQFQKVTRAGLVRSLRDGGALLFQLVPGQINMRAQLVLSTVYLGAETTALFIYAKQVVTALTQIIGFVLRVEFPGLVEKMAASRKQSFGSILGAQKTTLYCAVAFTVGATGGSGIAAIVPDFSLHRAATIMVSFTPTILTLSLSLMMMQALAALGAYAVIGRAAAISAAAGIFVSYMLVSTLGAYAFVLGEVTLHLLGFYIVYRYLRYLS